MSTPKENKQAVLDELRARINSLGACEEPFSACASSSGTPEKAAERKPATQTDGKSAYAKILRLAAVRERSSAALRARLAHEGFDEVEIEQAIEKACNLGVVDDARFAESLYRSRIAQGKGVAGVKRELEQLDIDPAVVSDIQEADESAELLRALAFLRAKPPRAKNKRDAAYRKLIGRGYNSSVAASAARIWFEETTPLV